MAITDHMSDEDRAWEKADDTMGYHGWARQRHDYSDRTRSATPKEDTTEEEVPGTQGVVQLELGNESRMDPKGRAFGLSGIAEARKALAAAKMAEKATESGEDTLKENLQAS